MEAKEVAELISAFAQLGWLILAGVFLYSIYPELYKRLSKLSKLSVDPSGKIELSMQEELVERVIAKKELAAKEEAQDEAGSVQAEDIHPASCDVIIWATGGARRPSGEIAVLKDAGFRVEEINPIQLPGSNLLEAKSVGALVTNLKHGRNYNGGLDLVQVIRKVKPDFPVILYTSKAALERRGPHIEKFGANEIATDTFELLLAAQKLSRASGERS